MADAILLVEDSADDVLFLSHAFRKAEVRQSLHVVEDGQRALDYLAGKNQYADRSLHPLPALILLDLKLPDVSGFEILRWLRNQPALRDIIVVVLTSSDRPADLKEAYALDANSFLSKPSNPDDLSPLITSVVEYWLRKNVSEPEANSAGLP